MLRQKLATVLAKKTGVWADTGVLSTVWAEKKTFLGKVPTLPCGDTRAVAEMAREYTHGPLAVSIGSNGF